MLLNKDEQEQFCTQYGITEECFRESLLTWDLLDRIAFDYEDKKDEHMEILERYEKQLKECPYVHSLSCRNKDVYHLIEKIIRKNPDRMKCGRAINEQNYISEITDLLGVRILILFKADWLDIHKFIMQKYDGKLAEDPFVYIRKGDDRSIYDDYIKIREKDAYRSVHYLIKDESDLTIEVQVRTLFEEAWSEIDHTIRYPYDVSNEMVELYVSTMNRIAGIGDEMASFVRMYQKYFKMSQKKALDTDNHVYQTILEKIEYIEDKKIKEEIKDIIIEAEEYKEVIQMKKVFDDYLKSI